MDNITTIEKFGGTDGFYLNCIDLDIKDKDVEIVTGDFREIDLIYKKWKNNGKRVLVYVRDVVDLLN